MFWRYNNIALITIAAAVSLVAWLYGGARGDLLMSYGPWILVFVLEVIFCFPQHRKNEGVHEARIRVWKELRHGALFLSVCGFLLLISIPFLNNGLCPNCDAELIANGIKADPPIPFIPFCVNRLDHLNTVLWFAIALFSAAAVFHCLTRSGKRKFVELIMWNGVALAILGFVQLATDAPGPFWSGEKVASSNREFFSSFGYVNMAADFFTLMFGLAMALWRDHYEQIRKEEEERQLADRSGKDAKRYGKFWRRHYFLIPSAILFFAAINTLSRSAIVMAALLAVIFFIHTLMCFTSRMHRQQRVKTKLLSTAIFAIVVFFSAIMMPKNIRKEVDTLESCTMLDRFTGRGQYHVRVATEILKDYPLFGCGGWGYAHFCQQYMTEKELPGLQWKGGANVHNDYMQFLAEHGLVGVGFLALIVIILIAPVASGWRRLAKGVRFLTGRYLPPKPRRVFVLPAPVFFMLISLIATFIHAFFDCPLRSCAVLTTFFTVLASFNGFMPKAVDAQITAPAGSDAHERQHHHHHHHFHHHKTEKK